MQRLLSDGGTNNLFCCCCFSLIVSEVSQQLLLRININKKHRNLKILITIFFELRSPFWIFCPPIFFNFFKLLREASASSTIHDRMKKALVNGINAGEIKARNIVETGFSPCDCIEWSTMYMLPATRCYCSISLHKQSEAKNVKVSVFESLQHLNSIQTFCRTIKRRNVEV